MTTVAFTSTFLQYSSRCVSIEENIWVDKFFDRRNTSIIQAISKTRKTSPNFLVSTHIVRKSIGISEKTEPVMAQVYVRLLLTPDTRHTVLGHTVESAPTVIGSVFVRRLRFLWESAISLSWKIALQFGFYPCLLTRI